MGASSVNGLTAAFWAKAKPNDYRAQDLDKALKTYEGVSGKALTIPNNLIPKAPKPTIGEIEDCIKELQSAVTELQKGLTLLKPIISALEGVQGAAGKASAELRKQAKDKQDDAKQKYENAATTADSISSLAAGALKDYK